MNRKLVLFSVVCVLAAIALAAWWLPGRPSTMPLYPEGIPPEADSECISDSDCGTGGCSSQICGQKDEVAGIITTCEYLTEYDCLKLTSCGCVSGKCQWKQNSAYEDCLKAST